MPSAKKGKSLVMWSFYYFDESIVDALNDYRIEKTMKKAKPYAAGEFKYPYSIVKIIATDLNHRPKKAKEG